MVVASIGGRPSKARGGAAPGDFDDPPRPGGGAHAVAGWLGIDDGS
jgi:hypothetical protein